ncbi:hypothetical protein BH23ACT11_BH23ACT11_21010 [soil metagenome]
MLDAAHRARELSRGNEVGSLQPHSETGLALTRLLEILGEASAKISPGLKTRHPEVPWRDVADTRNLVVHEYFDVDMEIVKAIIEDDLSPLIEQLEMVLKEIEESGGEGERG